MQMVTNNVTRSWKMHKLRAVCFMWKLASAKVFEKYQKGSIQRCGHTLASM
jgi:hypothetical protein